MSLLYPRKIDCPESPTGFRIAPEDQRLIDQHNYQLGVSQRRAEQREAEANHRAEMARLEAESQQPVTSMYRIIGGEHFQTPEQQQRDSESERKRLKREERERADAQIDILQRMPREMLEDFLLSFFERDSAVRMALDSGGDRKRIMRQAVSELLAVDDLRDDLRWACNTVLYWLREEAKAKALLAPEPKRDDKVKAEQSPINIFLNGEALNAAAVSSPSPPPRPADLWQRCTFSGVAYAGGVMLLPQGRVVLDLQSTRIAANPTPVYQQHRGERVVGNARLTIDRSNNVIHLTNGQFLDTFASREVLSGFDPETGKSHPWQASIGTGQVERWERHKGRVRVNGRMFTDVIVARGATVEECSFVGQGADLFRPNLTIRWKSK